MYFVGWLRQLSYRALVIVCRMDLLKTPSAGGTNGNTESIYFTSPRASLKRVLCSGLDYRALVTASTMDAFVAELTRGMKVLTRKRENATDVNKRERYQEGINSCQKILNGLIGPQRSKPAGMDSFTLIVDWSDETVDPLKENIVEFDETQKSRKSVVCGMNIWLRCFS